MCSSVAKINEVFYSFQGEGYWTGAPMHFIRFAGCNLRCEWCDTKYSWDDSLQSEVYLDNLVSYLERNRARRVCLTGGEPLLQPAAITYLYSKTKNVLFHLETNGTLPLPLCKLHWVTVSPKPPGYHVVIPAHAINEIKIVITQHRDLKAVDVLAQAYPDTWISLQPNNNSEEMRHLCMGYLSYLKSSERYRLSMQVHKLVGVK